MTTIYVLIVKEPPNERHGCRSCQFESGFTCSVNEYKITPANFEIPEWCPLQKVEVK